MDLDGEGRITQVTAGTGQNPVTGVAFNTASFPTQVNFGSGDNDIFAYDSNTLRMNQFKFNIGATPQSYVGSLTWNANGTLGQLAITDPFNAADTQTCNYAHDDFVRIASANCGTAASQTFSYDPFGNLSTSGSPYSFQASYSNTTNRITCIGGSGQNCTGGVIPTYDANGNTTLDSLHIYAWDADGNSITVDSVSVTYDALDRAVEQNRSGSYTEMVYAPAGGKLALMNGQTLLTAFVPLPRGATAVYTSAGLAHYRHSDWLGSARLTSSPSQTYLSSTAYTPFGDTYASSGTLDPSFTGQNSDTVSTDYDFLFRTFSTTGRWASPDPAGLAAVDPSNPQSWNRYAYVLNYPLSLLDLVGLCPFETRDLRPACGGGGAGGDGCDPIVDPSSCGDPPPCDPFMDPFPCDDGGGIGIGVGGGLAGGAGGGGAPPQNGSGTTFPGNPIGEIVCVSIHGGPPMCVRTPWPAWLIALVASGGATVVTVPIVASLPSTEDIRAIDLGHALNNTHVQSLGNPCTVAAFYAGSAILGATSGAVAGGEARGAGAAIYRGSARFWSFIFRWLHVQAMTGFPAARTVRNAARGTANALQNGCNAMQ